MEIGLSLGSNLGDRLENLRQARRRIAALPGVCVIQSSAVYETEPVDVPERYAGLPFLNAVLIIDSALDVDRLLDNVLIVELEMGRDSKHDRNSPRQIDIDIIFAGDLAKSRPDGGVPHPRWAERRFVAQPLADLRPDLRIPGEQRTVRDVLLALPASPNVVLFARVW